MVTTPSARLPSSAHVVAGVGGLVALLAIAVVVALVLVVELRDATGRADADVAYASAIQVAALNAKALANDERGFLISGDREFVDQMTPRVASVRSAFDDAEQAAVGNSQRAVIYEARAGFERWFHAVQREIAMYERDRRAAVRASLGQTRALRKSYEASFARAAALGDTAVESSTSEVSSSSWRAVRILLVYLVIALGVGFVLTAWLVHAVLRPVATLQQPLPEQAPELRRMR